MEQDQKRNRCLMAAALAVVFGVASARAAEAGDAVSPAQGAARQDFGMLSNQGSAAFRDVRLARLAIFDGQVSKARQDVIAAQAALGRARNDAAAYTKAESDLTPPPGMVQRKGGEDVAAGPVRWLPVDGAMTVDEDYAASPAGKAGMSRADAQIKGGDRKGAMDTLRLAGMKVSFELEVIPIAKATEEVGNAAKLLAAGSYYEANQALKSVEDGARFDVATLDGPPGTVGSGMAGRPAAPAHDAG